MVIVLDKNKRPMGFTTPRRARILLTKQRAVVHKMYPFTIRIKDRDVREFETKTHHIKIDPGSKTTGIAVVDDSDNSVKMFIQLEHRGDAVKAGLQTRAAARRNRRNRETRYRRCKWINHYLKKGSKYKAESPRPEGWLPPSVKSIADNIVNLIKKLHKLILIDRISIEAVKFDTQLMDNPDISGVEYQQGTLFGYEVREYLLEKYGHTCQYCGGASKDPVLEVEHIVSRNNGGTNKPSNLGLACHACNRDKGSLNLDRWLEELKAIPTPSKLDKARIECVTKFLDGKPLVRKNYAAWVNSYRNYLVQKAFEHTPNVELATGGRTKFNRTQLNLPKDHHIDALCVGNVPEDGYKNINQPVLHIKAMGRGNRLIGNINKCGIITVKYKNNSKAFIKRDKNGKITHSFMTGDIVKADIPKGKYAGQYIGRIAIRSSGYFKLLGEQTAPSVKYEYCKVLQRNDGYNYCYRKEKRGTLTA